MVNAMPAASATASNRAFIDSPQALRASRRHLSGLLTSEPTEYAVISPAAHVFITCTILAKLAENDLEMGDTS
jgi:hypothetical protein